MTTIATDGETMAGDGRRMRGETMLIVQDDCVKVHRLSDGRIVGGAGETGDIEAFREWLEAGCQGARPKASAMAALVLHTDGCLEYYSEKSGPIATTAPHAIGSGEEIAWGAMEIGASPVEAVAAAARKNAGTGGLITRLSRHGEQDDERIKVEDVRIGQHP